MTSWPWLGGSVGWSITLHTKSLWAPFPVRAHTWAVGSIPGNLLMFLPHIHVSRSLFLPPTLSLSLKSINISILR